MENTARFTFYGSKLDGSARQPGLCGQLLERGRDPVRAPTLNQAGCVGTRDEDEVMAMRKRVVQRPERLSQCPLHGISLYGAADLAAHRDAKSNLVVIVVGLAARKGIEDRKRLAWERPSRYTRSKSPLRDRRPRLRRSRGVTASAASDPYGDGA